MKVFLFMTAFLAATQFAAAAPALRVSADGERDGAVKLALALAAEGTPAVADRRRPDDIMSPGRYRRGDNEPLLGDVPFLLVFFGREEWNSRDRDIDVSVAGQRVRGGGGRSAQRTIRWAYYPMSGQTLGGEVTISDREGGLDVRLSNQLGGRIRDFFFPDSIRYSQSSRVSTGARLEKEISALAKAIAPGIQGFAGPAQPEHHHHAAPERDEDTSGQATLGQGYSLSVDGPTVSGVEESPLVSPSPVPLGDWVRSGQVFQVGRNSRQVAEIRLTRRVEGGWEWELLSSDSWSPQKGDNYFSK